MLILRQITKDGQESNLVLGGFYQVIKNETHPTQFQNSSYVKSMDIKMKEDCYAIILYTSKDKQQVWPLYKGFQYYVMSDSGKTFDNLTFKP